ncbi:MAG: BCCT family transporter, partial [Bacteroidota bacterium]
SAEAEQFAVSTMFMHWTLTPYGIYTLAGLLFALSYYNLKQPFSLGSLLYPVVGDRAHGYLGTITDIICLYGLVAGMAASLGTGILTLMGGMESVLGLKPSNFLLAIIALSVVITFIISAASGLMKGIRILSDFNIKAFMGLAIFILIAGPTLYMAQVGAKGLVDFVVNFLPRSVNIGSNLDQSWLNSWTIFYWANWLAWTPITALFLGRLSVGYTVRDYIHYNLIFPSIFGGLWMVIFGGTSMYKDLNGDGFLYNILTTEGEQNVIFTIMRDLPLGAILSVAFLFIVFVSYVTAADSNTSAMSGVSTKGITPDNPEAPLLIKVIWGSLIGIIAWVMITTAGVDGIRMLSVLGGFPALFLVIAVAIGLVRLIGQKDRLMK